MVAFIPRSLAAVVAILSLSAVRAEEAKLTGEGGSLEDRPSLEASQQKESQKRGQQGEKFWSIGLRTATEYDTNVRLDDDAEQKDDARFIVGANLRIKLPTVLDIKTTAYYSLYKDYYDELDEFDLEGHIFGVSLSKSVSPKLYAFLDYAFLYYYFDGEGYLRRHMVRPTGYWVQTPSFATLARFTWDNSDYLPLRALSGDNYALAVREFFYFGEGQAAHLYAEYAANYNKAVQDYEQYLGHKLSVGGTSPLWWEVTGHAELSYSSDHYKGRDPRFSDQFRHDNTFKGTVLLSRPVYKEVLRAGVYYNLTRQRSSISARDYTDHVMGVEMNAQF